MDRSLCAVIRPLSPGASGTQGRECQEGHLKHGVGASNTGRDAMTLAHHCDSTRSAAAIAAPPSRTFFAKACRRPSEWLHQLAAAHSFCCLCSLESSLFISRRLRSLLLPLPRLACCRTASESFASASSGHTLPLFLSSAANRHERRWRRWRGGSCRRAEKPEQRRRQGQMHTSRRHSFRSAER